MYRVVQEALSNVVRHSGAESVSVHVGLDGASVVGVVEDDGCGFEQVLVGGGGGLGLMGMRERAVGAGGQVTVQSELGRGTRVRLVIPLNNGDA